MTRINEKLFINQTITIWGPTGLRHTSKLIIDPSWSYKNYMILVDSHALKIDPTFFLITNIKIINYVHDYMIVTKYDNDHPPSFYMIEHPEGFSSQI